MYRFDTCCADARTGTCNRCISRLGRKEGTVWNGLPVDAFGASSRLRARFESRGYLCMAGLFPALPFPSPFSSHCDPQTYIFFAASPTVSSPQCKTTRKKTSTSLPQSSPKPRPPRPASPRENRLPLRPSLLLLLLLRARPPVARRVLGARYETRAFIFVRLRRWGDTLVRVCYVWYIRGLRCWFVLSPLLEQRWQW